METLIFASNDQKNPWAHYLWTPIQCALDMPKLIKMPKDNHGLIQFNSQIFHSNLNHWKNFIGKMKFYKPMLLALCLLRKTKFHYLSLLLFITSEQREENMTVKEEIFFLFVEISRLVGLSFQ